MAQQPSARFRLLGGNLTLEQLIKDCRSLEDEVNSLKKQVESLQTQLAQAQKGSS